VLAPMRTNFVMRTELERENYEIVSQSASIITEHEKVKQLYHCADTNEARVTIARHPALARLVGLASTRLQSVDRTLEAEFEASLPRQEEALRNLQVLTAPAEAPELLKCELFGCEKRAERRLACMHKFCTGCLFDLMSSTNERNTGPDRDHPLVRQTCPLCRHPFTTRDFQNIDSSVTTSAPPASAPARASSAGNLLCEVRDCPNEGDSHIPCGHFFCEPCVTRACERRVGTENPRCPTCNQTFDPPSPMASPVREQPAVPPSAAAAPPPDNQLAVLPVRGAPPPAHLRVDAMDLD